MSTATAFNPNLTHNETLLAAGASKTVYALVTPYTERAKADLMGNEHSVARSEYLSQFREAWTAKQDAYDREFFDLWHKWASPVVELDRSLYPFTYFTNGASEPIRHLIYDLKCRDDLATVHFFEGEYEGYKAMAEAAGLRILEHNRDDWRYMLDRNSDDYILQGDLFFISQPSAIDGMVWPEFNEFVTAMPANRLVVDVTYVGAVPSRTVPVPFLLNARSIRNVVFSLSKPFGCYYDRIGGIFCREQDDGLFGNKWFKNLTSIALGKQLLRSTDVFLMAEKYGEQQRAAVAAVSKELGLDLKPADVFILATGEPTTGELPVYLTRADKLRVCLTPAMAKMIGTAA